MRIVLADDHQALRAAFKALLETEPGVEVVGEATDGAECLRRVEESRPDLVLMDVRMPGVDGAQATNELRTRFPQVRVVALTAFEDVEHVAAMIGAGAVGYLLKTLPAAELRAAVRAAAEGRPVMSPEVYERVLADVASLYREQESQRQRVATSRRTRRELLTMLSDELQNPLTAVSGAAVTLRRGWHRLDDRTRDELLAQVEEQAARLGARVADLLDAVAEDVGPVFDLADAVRRAVARLGVRHGDRAHEEGRLEVAVGPARALGDPLVAVTVATALIGDALRRTSGRVRVATWHETGSRRSLLEIWGHPADAAGQEAGAAWPAGAAGQEGFSAQAIRGLLHGSGARLEAHEDAGDGARLLVVFKDG